LNQEKEFWNQTLQPFVINIGFCKGIVGKTPEVVQNGEAYTIFEIFKIRATSENIIEPLILENNEAVFPLNQE
jgi:hypothetical protein